MSDGYDIANHEEFEPERSAASGTLNVHLGEILECTEMIPRVWYLDPGDATSLHRQDKQEEFYYVIEGPGRMRIEDETMTVEEGTTVRVSPDTRRRILNDTDGGQHAWLVIGAPPADDDGIIIEE